MALYGKVASNKALREVIGVPKVKRLGLGWPIGKNSRQPYFSKASSMYLIKSQIKQLLRTRKGERPMLPDYGIEIEKYLFDPLTSTIAAQLATEVRRAITLYASNIRLLSVRVFSDENIKGYGMPGLLINLTIMPSGENQSLDVDIVI